jgi:uncharacterized protein with FMN-binding domain
MKKIFNKHGLITLLVLFIAIIFVVGGFYSRFMTNQIEVHREENAGNELNTLFLGMFDQATKVEVFTTTPVDISYLKPLSTTETFKPELVGSYKVFNGTIEVGVIYVVNSFGRYDSLQVAYAISRITDSIVGVKVISNKETQSYFSALGDTFFAQFNNKSLDDLGFSVDAVAGSTMSSKGIEVGMFYAREQYANDFGFVIPTIIMTLNSLKYNFDPLTFVSKPYIADVTYGDENINVVVYLDASFSYAGTITGDEPEEDVQSGIKSYASSSGLVSTSVKFVSFDNVTRTLVMTSKGYNAVPIQVSFILNAGLTAVESFTVSSMESYDDDYNGGYNKALGLVPYVERNLINKYKDGMVEIDAIAGATVTSHAILDMIDVLKLFIAEQNGGD